MLTKPKIAALEFEGDTIRLAVIKAGGRLPTVLELHEETAIYDDPEGRVEALTEAVESILARLKGRPAAYVLCISTMSAIVRAMTIPFRGQGRVLAAAQMALEDHLAFPIEKLFLDSKVVAEVDGETEVLVMGVRRDHLEEQLTAVEGAGIAVEAVCLDAAGLTALWAGGRKGLKGLHAVLHLRESNASLVITHNKNLAFIRHLSCTAAQIKENPAAAGRDVQNTIRAFTAKWRAGGEIETLHITGVVLDPAESEAFSQAAALPVAAAVALTQLKGGDAALQAVAQEKVPKDTLEQPPDEIDAPPKIVETPANRWESMIGVAVTARGGRFAMNFNKGENVWNGVLRATATHLMFASCIALIALLAGAKYYQRETSKNDKLVAELVKQTQEIATKVDGIRNQVQESIEPSYFSDPTILDLLDEISENFPESKVAINNINMASPGTRGAWITIKGTTTQGDALADIIEKLGDSKQFTIATDPGLTLIQEVTHFTVKAFRIEEEVSEE